MSTDDATGEDGRSVGPRPTLVFDDSCPMCKVYTGAFDALGWSQRTPFSRALDDYGDLLDLDRARHEIPMIDEAAGTVRYGLDGLGHLLADRVPALAWWFRHPLVLRYGQPVYDFISYNRREIAGSPPPASGFDCAPDHHRTWMLRYQAAAAATTGVLSIGAPVALVAGGASAGVATVALGALDTEASDEARTKRWSHVVTCAVVAAAVTRLVTTMVRRPRLGLAVGVAAGAHQIARRRHIVD